jgi:hypothetical protein
MTGSQRRAARAEREACIPKSMLDDDDDGNVSSDEEEEEEEE